MPCRQHQPGCLQDGEEFADWLQLLRAERVTSYLEVGAHTGGAVCRVAQVLPISSRIVVVDLPYQTYSEQLRETVQDIKDIETHIVWGDSTSPRTIAEVKQHAPFDAVFIDADHSEAYATSDWLNYGPMGRIVAFHDIAWSRPSWPDHQKMYVPVLWEQLKKKYRHREIKHCPTRCNNGIGVLWRFT